MVQKVWRVSTPERVRDLQNVLRIEKLKTYGSKEKILKIFYNYEIIRDFFMNIFKKKF